MNKINKLKDLIDEHFFKLEKLKTNNLKKDELHSHLSQHNNIIYPCTDINCTNLKCTKLHKCKHYKCHEMMNLKDEPKLHELPELPEVPKYKYNYKSAQYEETVESGGLTNVGVKLQKEFPNARIGTMVAGNSGLPGGSCGDFNGNGDATGLYAYHNTQEEDVVSNWLRTTSFKNNIILVNHTDKKTNKKRYTDKKIFRHTIYEQWGMKVQDWKKTYMWSTIKYDISKDIKPKNSNRKEDYTNTIQGVNYTKAEPYEYADAWVVHSAHLSEKVLKIKMEYNKPVVNKYYDFNNTYLTTLVFVAGPNCGTHGSTVNSSMTRTFNTSIKSYNIFEKSVESALFAGLYAMAAEGCTIALLAYVSAGIYAGPYETMIKNNFKNIVNRVLKRKCRDIKNNKEIELGKYFDNVILTKL